MMRYDEISMTRYSESIKWAKAPWINSSLKRPKNQLSVKRYVIQNKMLNAENIFCILFFLKKTNAR